MTATVHKFSALLPAGVNAAMNAQAAAGHVHLTEKQQAENIILAYINALPEPGDNDEFEGVGMFESVPGYAPLEQVLRAAYDQSARGKGKERHANAKPFLMQPIMSIGRMVGPGYQLGQAMKKSQEAFGMFSRGNTSAATAEMLGVIVYAAAAILLMEEQETKL